MSYKFLVEQNKEYKEFYEKFNEVLRQKRESLVEINNTTLKDLDLNELDYTELKELMDLIGCNVDESIKDELKKAYLSKKPYDNKVVEKIDFLSNDNKAILDEGLSRFKNKYITFFFWGKISLNVSLRERILKILLDEGLIKVHYGLRCPRCRDYIKLLKDKDLEAIEHFESLKLKISECENDKSFDNAQLLGNLYKEYYDIEENLNPMYHYCENCDNEIEFDTLEDLIDSSKKEYFVL